MMYDQTDYSELWNEMDELLIEYPELSELWLDREKLAQLRSRYPGKDDLKEYFRKRAFTSLVMEKIFRVYEAIEESGGEEEVEGITLDNPELYRIWKEDIKDEYSDFPEFILYVAQEVFSSEGGVYD